MGAQVRAPLPGGGGVARRFGAVLPRLALPASLRSCSPSGTPLAARALLHGADCRLPNVHPSVMRLSYRPPRLRRFLRMAAMNKNISFVLFALASWALAKPAIASTTVAAAPENMVHLLSFWVVDYKRQAQADWRVQTMSDADSVVEALHSGAVGVGLMTRPLTERELAAFEGRHGRRLQSFRVARDALAVYVHRSNPVKGITRQQLDGLFSTSRRCGAPENIFWWDQLGVKGGEWDVRQIELFGPNARSGERASFSASVLCAGTHKATLEMARNEVELMYLLAANPAGVAYSSLLPPFRNVRRVPIASESAQGFVEPDLAAIRAGRYPLVRDLYLYVDAARLGPQAEAFMQLVLSPQGQALAEMNGFAAVAPTVAARAQDGPR